MIEIIGGIYMINEINLNLYKVFYYVATLKSFNEAAEKLYVSQPAISKQIKNLETLLNVKLFHRMNKGIELTKEGQLLLENIEKSFFYLELSNKELDQLKQFNIGELAIGCPSHITSFYLLKYVEEFKKQHPGITVRIDSSSTKELLEKLSKNKIDFIIDSFSNEVDDTKFLIRPIKDFETIFITSNKEDIKYKTLESNVFVLPPERSSMRKNLDKILHKNNIKLNISLMVDTTDLIISAVKNNMGIGYIIKNAVINEINNKEIYEIPINFELPRLELELVYSKEYVSIIAQEFIKKYIN